MAYCVNCGVKLDMGLQACPLCNEPAVKPKVSVSQPFENAEPRPKQDEGSGLDKHLWINLISVVLAAPAAISFVIDFFFGNGVTWSGYVISSLLLVWIWCVSPFLLSRNIPSFWISVDAAALLGFFYYIDKISARDDWFFPLALPITICLTLFVLVLTNLFRRKILRELHKAAGLLLSIGVFCMLLELFIDRYLRGFWQPGWSLIVWVGCTALAMVAIVLQRRRWIVEEIKFWLRM